jgi:hypothetical protein
MWYCTVVGVVVVGVVVVVDDSPRNGRRKINQAESNFLDCLQ